MKGPRSRLSRTRYFSFRVFLSFVPPPRPPSFFRASYRRPSRSRMACFALVSRSTRWRICRGRGGRAGRSSVPRATYPSWRPTIMIRGGRRTILHGGVVSTRKWPCEGPVARSIVHLDRSLIYVSHPVMGQSAPHANNIMPPATTVAATMRLAHAAGISTFVTGERFPP